MPERSEIAGVFFMFALWLIIGLVGFGLFSWWSKSIAATTQCEAGYYLHPISGSCVPKTVTFWNR